MRYIDKQFVRSQIQAEWKQKADRVAKLVADAPPEERAALIDANRGVWSEIKLLFEKILDGKCWYSESKNPGCDKDIDHFRPKSAVWGCPDHPGYWWLAFDWRNYRFCAQFCNRSRTDPTTRVTGGKATHFPLLNPQNRVNDQAVAVDTTERTILLDPFVSTDWQLLSFEPDGRIVARWPKDERPEQWQRATISAEIYNLNFHTFRKDRAELYSEIEGLIEEGDAYVETDLRTVRENQRLAFDAVVAKLLRKVNINAPYSSAARDYIRRFRSRNWVDEHVVQGF